MLSIGAPVRFKIIKTVTPSAITLHSNYPLNATSSYSLYYTNDGFAAEVDAGRDALGLVRQIATKAMLSGSGVAEIRVAQFNIQVMFSPAVDLDVATELVRAAVRTAGLSHVFV